MCGKPRSSRRATVDNIYAVPEAYHAEGLDTEVLAAFGLEAAASPDLDRWRLINERIRNPEGDVTIAIVGKYTGMKDAYKSLIEALSHGGIANKVKVNLDWIESEVFEREDPAPFLEARERHPGAGRFRSARRRGQDPRGAVRARARPSVFRHLLRHADGGDRGGAEPVRHRGGELDGVRRHLRAGGRPDDRMAQGQRARAAGGGRRPRGHDAAWRLSGASFAGQPSRGHLRNSGHLRASPPPL